MSSFNYSIIIPHYNIPELLKRTLNSIPIRQDIQVIVVDDCSPNAESYEENYPDFKRPYLEWYSTPKGGSAGRARNVGLDHAKGKWIIFIDADDLFVDNVEEILDEALTREEDILFYNYLSVYSDDLNKKAIRVRFQQFFDKYNDYPNEDPFRYDFDIVWSKIIKRDLIESHHIRCDETKYANDIGFSVQTGYYAKKIAIFNKLLCINTLREDSLASSFYFEKESTKEERIIRTNVIFKWQNFLDSKGIGYEIHTFNYFKEILIENNLHFLRVIPKYLFMYPYAATRTIKFWGTWKIKAIRDKIKIL